MSKAPPGLTLPRNLDDIDADFMTALLKARGLISPTNKVVTTDEAGVGMTAGYFSAIKKVKCHFAEATDSPSTFVAKAWPDSENAPKEQIADMFAREIAAYDLESVGFYPTPKIYLADCNPAEDRWVLIMDDANAFGDQKLHENELTLEEVLHMVPKLVDVAVAWEGCHEGPKSDQMSAMNVLHWASDANLAAFKQIMPGGAPLFNYVTAQSESKLINGLTWHDALGKDISTLFTSKIDAFYEPIKPENGGTCTLCHGDIRGDNLFFCEATDDYPDGWLTIDYQLMFQGPIPSDLAYLMNSGSVLPEVYSGENRQKILKTFYDQFMAKTKLYKDYTWEQFNQEYAAMATVLFIYFVGFGANIWQAGCNNELAVRVELGTKGETEADLSPEEQRQRMWWRKALANFRSTFKDYNHYEQLQSLPDNATGMAEWFPLPAHLR